MRLARPRNIVALALLTPLASACVTADDGMSYGARDHLDRQFRVGPIQEGSYDRTSQSYNVNGAWVSGTSAQGTALCNRTPEADECVNSGGKRSKPNL